MKRQNWISLVFAILPGVIFPVSGLCQDCIDYGQYIHWSHIVPTEDWAIDIAVSGDLAYVATLEAGLTIMDVREPNAASIIGGIDTPGYAYAVGVNGDYAYVADGPEGLQVIRIKNSSYPTAVAGMATVDSALDVLVRGQYAYLADKEGGVHVVDVSNPRKPAIVATIETPGKAYDLAFGENLLFVADHSGGLHIIDVSDSESPFTVSTLDIDRDTYVVTLVDNIAFVGTIVDLRLVDVSNPAAPAMLSVIPKMGKGTVIVREGMAYVAAESGVHLIDVRDPAQPEVLGEVRCQGMFFRSIALVDDSLLTAASIGIQVISGVGHTQAELAGQADSTARDVRDVAISGNYLYASDHDITNPGLKVYSLDNPFTPRLLGSVDIPAWSYHIAVGGNYVYVADLNYKLHIVNVENPDNPRVVAALELEGRAFDVIVDGGYVYLGCLSAGFMVFDISDPINPVSVARLELQGVSAVTARGNRAFARCSESGQRGLFTEIDISDPASPRVLGSVEIPFNSEARSDLAIDGNFAYLAYISKSQETGTERGALLVFDISDPGSPLMVGDLTTIGYSRGVAVHGRYAYVSSVAGISVVDVSEPRFLTLVGHVQVLGGYTNGLAVGDHAMYAGQDLHGVIVANFQCALLGQIEVEIDVKPGNQIDAVNCGSRGVLPVAVLTTPEFDATTIDHETVVFGPGRAQEAHHNSHGMLRHEADVDGDGDTDLLFHFQTQECGLTCNPGEQVSLSGQTWDGSEVFGMTTIRPVPGSGAWAKSVTGLSTQPNPFNPSTKIRFELAHEASVRLRIYDVSGRLVRNLIDGERLGAGPRAVVWQGRDDRGSPVPSGVYFYRLETGGYSETKRMVLIK